MLTEQRDNGQSFQQWLDQHGQTPNGVARFWHPILVSALSEELDRISVSAAAQVVRESMKSPEARHMGVPTFPLTDFTTPRENTFARGVGYCIFAARSKLLSPIAPRYIARPREKRKSRRKCRTIVRLS